MHIYSPWIQSVHILTVLCCRPALPQWLTVIWLGSNQAPMIHIKCSFHSQRHCSKSLRLDEWTMKWLLSTKSQIPTAQCKCPPIDCLSKQQLKIEERAVKTLWSSLTGLLYQILEGLIISVSHMKSLCAFTVAAECFRPRQSKGRSSPLRRCGVFRNWCSNPRPPLWNNRLNTQLPLTWSAEPSAAF